MKALTKPF
ncbi:hypothetical protein VCHC50A2_3904A, partial [Vibrio cholerae HC-50A2]